MTFGPEKKKGVFKINRLYISNMKFNLYYIYVERMKSVAA